MSFARDRLAVLRKTFHNPEKSITPFYSHSLTTIGFKSDA
jgi:hypothetical protein